MCSFFNRIDALNGGQLSRGDSTSVWLRRDGGELGDWAYESRRTVEDRGAGDAAVKESFERLSRSYHALRDEGSVPTAARPGST